MPFTATRADQKLASTCRGHLQGLARSEASKGAARQRGRGEAEPLAWATSDPTRREYRSISCDKKARELAKSLGLATGDVLDLGIHWLRLSLISRATLDDAFAP